MTLVQTMLRTLLNDYTKNVSYRLIKCNNNEIIKRYAQTGTKNVCWKCGLEKSETTQFFCEKCNSIQVPQDGTNYFKIFQLEEAFNLDDRVLRDRYRKIQSRLHPDKFANKSDEERNISAEYSSLVNKAYNSLHVPVKRAEYLLNLKGENIGEDKKIDDPDFLMAMMELNEEVDNAQDTEKIKELNIKNKNNLEKVANEIDVAFKNNDIENAKENVIKMKYYASLGNRINAILRESGETD